MLSRFQDPFVTIRGLPLFGDYGSYILVLIAPDPLDPVGDRLRQAGVAAPLQLTGRAQSGHDLKDGQG